MARSKNAAPYVWGAAILALTALFSWASWEGMALLSVAAFAILITKMADGDNIFQMSFLCGHYSFLVFPLFLHAIYGNHFIGAYTPILCSAGMLVAFAFSERRPSYAATARLAISLKSYFVVFAAFVAVLIATSGASYLYTVPFLTVAFHLLILSTRRAAVIGTAYALGMVGVGIYYTQYSSGYGRLTMAAPLFVMTMMLLSWLRLPLRKPILLTGVVFGAAAGTMVRSDVSFTANALAEASLTASTSSPLVLMDQIVSSHYAGYGVRIGAWFDQVLLFFFGPIPRVMWPSKPEGFSFLYTVENLETYLVRAGHSIAALYTGEHVYYLGPIWGILGAGVAVIMVCALWHVFCRIWGGYLAAGIVVNIPSFYWGGMQPYSVRTLMWLVPAIVLAVIFLRLDGTPRWSQHRLRPEMRDQPGALGNVSFEPASPR